MEKVFAKKLGFLPDKENPVLFLDKVKLKISALSDMSIGDRRLDKI
ncbi:MAG: hypothetical protein V7K79_03700 [Nostoc sp.]